MNRKIVLTVVVITASFCHTGVSFGASFSDMLGGKKLKKTQILIEQQAQECKTKVDALDRKYRRIADEKKDSEDTIQGLRDKNNTLMEAYERSSQTKLLL